MMDQVKFFETIMKLKSVRRSGWVERGVKEPETSADHSLLVSLLVLILGKSRKLDLNKAVKMALLHDLPESIVGDIISKDKWEAEGKMWKKDKIILERKAMQELASLSGRREILELWDEFNDMQSPEAIFVEQADRLATILQAIEYYKEGNYRKPLPGFWDEKGTSPIKDPELKKLLDSALRKLR